MMLPETLSNIVNGFLKALLIFSLCVAMEFLLNLPCFD